MWGHHSVTPVLEDQGQKQGILSTSQLGEMEAVTFSETVSVLLSDVVYVRYSSKYHEVTKVDKMWSFNLTEE